MELDGLVPEDERMNLMFGYPPIDLSDEEFKSIIGNEKYQAHLNFFYGILVERVLHLVVQLELDKEKGGGACKPDDDDELFTRIYGASEADMIERFRQENGSPPGDVFTLTEFKQFTYWLFKFRVANSDSSRLASDTKKALKYLDGMLVKVK